MSGIRIPITGKGKGKGKIRWTIIFIFILFFPALALHEVQDENGWKEEGERKDIDQPY